MLVDVKVCERERKQIGDKVAEKKPISGNCTHHFIGVREEEEIGMNAGKWWDMAAERTWVMTLSEYRMTKRGWIGRKGYHQRSGGVLLLLYYSVQVKGQMGIVPFRCTSVYVP